MDGGGPLPAPAAAHNVLRVAVIAPFPLGLQQQQQQQAPTSPVLRAASCCGSTSGSGGVHAPVAAAALHAREYGAGFGPGFLPFYEDDELADVTVVVIDSNPHAEASATGRGAAVGAASSGATSCPRTYRLHSLLLAYHSGFFRAALAQTAFRDSAARRIELRLESAASAWPALVRFFYTDSIMLDDTCALPLLALARQLLVASLDGYCMHYVRSRLGPRNAVAHLRLAVQHALHDLHAECVALVARGFHVLYSSDLCGLPPATLVDILSHPDLHVHCEQQVVEAVLRYLVGTHVEPHAARDLCAQIRLLYLDNATITQLAADPRVIAVHEAAADSTSVVPTENSAAAAAAPCGGSQCSAETAEPSSSVDVPADATSPDADGHVSPTQGSTDAGSDGEGDTAQQLGASSASGSSDAHAVHHESCDAFGRGQAAALTSYCGILPRDVVLEGALLRLAAMQCQQAAEGTGLHSQASYAAAVPPNTCGQGRNPFRSSGGSGFCNAAASSGSRLLVQHPAHQQSAQAVSSAVATANTAQGGSAGASGRTGGLWSVMAPPIPPPRPTYCSNLLYGLPGGCTWADVELESIWERLVPYIAVQVSGCNEGCPVNVVSTDPDVWFETNDSADTPPWLELQMPRNVTVTHMARYTFVHGHRRAGYFRARNFKTLVAAQPGDQLVDLNVRPIDQGEVQGPGGTQMPWQVLRMQATGCQEDGVHRLCVRGMKVYGVARIDLMQQAGGFAVQPAWIHQARARLLAASPVRA